MLLTSKERAKWNSLKKGTYYGQVGITIRFGNNYWLECAGTIGTAGGDNSPSIVVAKGCHNKKKIVIDRISNEECYPIKVIGKDGGNGDRQTFGMSRDGAPCPTIRTCHHHAIALTGRIKA